MAWVEKVTLKPDTSDFIKSDSISAINYRETPDDFPTPTPELAGTIWIALRESE